MAHVSQRAGAPRAHDDSGAPSFKYRYVPSGTRFRAAAGPRTAVDGHDDLVLFENEIAVGVGRENWTGASDASVIIDHHVDREGGFPSSAVAVIHHAAMLRGRFQEAKPSVVWLVTHKHPNFDCFTAMYLARWFIEYPDVVDGFQGAGFRYNGFHEAAGTKRFDWFKPDLNRFPRDVQWAVLLASFAAHTDRAGRIVCPRNRALHSILYAAIQRGRPYGTEDNAAQEFFEEVRFALHDGGGSARPVLNPFYDSVLENNRVFAPELALLDVVTEAYDRDIARARKTIVFLPTRDDKENFLDVYNRVTAKPLLNPDHTIGEARQEFGVPCKPVDGMYLRDPECILLAEWARHDIDNSSLREGFTFTMIARSGLRSGPNDTDYRMAIDPRKAGHSNLYRVWARLQSEELAAWRRLENASRRAELPRYARSGYEQRAGDEPELFYQPWYDGFNYSCRVIGTPDGGTLLRAGIERGLEDDAVAMIVQEELEYVAYASPFTLTEVPARTGLQATKPYDAPTPRDDTEPVPEGYYRFGTVMLSEHVDLRSDVFAEQAGRVLWNMLHPGQLEGPPRELAQECCVREGDMLGIWSACGVMIAYKRSARESMVAVSALFNKVCEVVRGVGGLIAAYQAGDRPAEGGVLAATTADKNVGDNRAVTGLMLEVRQAFGQPEGRVIEGFAHRSGLFGMMDLLRGANVSEATHSNLTLTKRFTTATETVAKVQVKVESLELIFVLIYSTELANIVAEHVIPRSWQLFSTLMIALVLTGIVGWFLKLWETKEPDGHAGTALPMMYAFLAFIVAGIVVGTLSAAKMIPHEPLPVVIEPAATAHEPAQTRRDTPVKTPEPAALQQRKAGP